MPLNILLLSDERPGHYHLSEGVITAIARKTDVHVRRLKIARRKLLPARLLRLALKHHLLRQEQLLSLGYGVTAEQLGEADLIISAGGETLIANVAAAQCLNAWNIFCGSLRKIAPENFSLVITSFDRFAHLPNHMVSIKPNIIDPDLLDRPKQIPIFNEHNRPKVAGLLVGGNSGLFKYSDEDWSALIRFVQEASRELAIRWHISTSLRTGEHAADLFAKLAQNPDIVETFLDYRKAGPGTLADIFAACDITLCTEDSSTMMSEAICARLPTLGISPKTHSFEPREREYRQYLSDQNWCRSVPIASLNVTRFLASLSEIKPLENNHLDMLASKLQDRLPALFKH